ncbi:aminopeptidase P family protein [Mycoplasma marinum]|uniref:Xaa-Pro aminopeptidase n=1 Tax=Mycoplasma marinum TaxID=1937190 RepID=A0A4R0XSZ2_9MOLU|nr:aminopeptidase P family protein [Mycoplasma marinum]TCG10729.1 Xaa-Pro aminopeptidase [Mycoplasma marinum]
MDRRVVDKHFAEKGIDAIFVISDENRFWFTKVQSSFGYLIIEKNSAELFVDSRYIILAKKVAQNASVNLLEKNSMTKFAKSKQEKYKKIAIESDYATLDQLERVKRLFTNAEIVFISGQGLRNFKTEEEAENIRKAAHIGLDSFEQLKPEIVEGKTERELAARLEYLFMMNGAAKKGFDTIVASGENGAKPHAVPSEKKLKNGEFVTFDFGTVYNGYMSDTTRTIQVGEVTNPKLLEIYSIVEEAQRLGIEAVKPGVTGAEIDKVCRDYITNKGYGEYFGHGTGHGLGVEVHELPNTSVTNNEPLEVGHVVTVEPGIYIEGIGGVRIEDDVLVTKDGHKVLSYK